MPSKESTPCRATPIVPVRPSPPVRTPSHPTFLEQLQATNEPLTAAESDLAGPWKLEAVPATRARRRPAHLGEPRRGRHPDAVFRHRETAALGAALLPLVGREPLFHLSEDPDPDPSGPLAGGYPVVAVFGEQGPAVSGWLPWYHPEIVEALGLFEGLVRTPRSLAEVNAAAGAGALAQVGRYLMACELE